MTPKEKLITRLNESLANDHRWCCCPIDYPIVSHQRKYASSGGHNWYFKSDHSLYEKYGADLVHKISKFGSCFTISELLKYPNDYNIFEEAGNFELIPKKL